MISNGVKVFHFFSGLMFLFINSEVFFSYLKIYIKRSKNTLNYREIYFIKFMDIKIIKKSIDEFNIFGINIFI